MRCAISSQAIRQEKKINSSFLLFYSGLQWNRWGPPTLGRLIYCITHSNANFIQKHPHRQPEVMFNLGTSRPLRFTWKSLVGNSVCIHVSYCEPRRLYKNWLRKVCFIIEWVYLCWDGEPSSRYNIQWKSVAQTGHGISLKRGSRDRPLRVACRKKGWRAGLLGCNTDIHFTVRAWVLSKSWHVLLF